MQAYEVNRVYPGADLDPAVYLAHDRIDRAEDGSKFVKQRGFEALVTRDK
jgi:hypothetical protein